MDDEEFFAVSACIAQPPALCSTCSSSQDMKASVAAHVGCWNSWTLPLPSPWLHTPHITYFHARLLQVREQHDPKESAARLMAFAHDMLMTSRQVRAHVACFLLCACLQQC